MMSYKIHLCDNFSSVDFIHLIPFFSRIVWIKKFHDLMKRFSLTKVAIKKEKHIISVIIATIARRKYAS